MDTKKQLNPDKRAGRYFQQIAFKKSKRAPRIVYVVGDWQLVDGHDVAGHACFQISPEIACNEIEEFDPEKWEDVTAKYTHADRKRHQKDWQRLSAETKAMHQKNMRKACNRKKHE